MQSSMPQPSTTLLGRARLAAVVGTCLALLLASCQNQPQPQPGTVDRVGLILLNQAAATGAPIGQASFVALTAARAEELMSSPFGTQVGTCVVSTATAPATGTVGTGAGGSRLNAGDILFSTGSGTYGLLEREDDGRYTMHTTEPLPTTGLRLRLVGTGAFPAFTNVAINTGTAPELAPGFDPAAVTVDSEFGWTPGSAGSAVLLVGTGTGTAGVVAYSCLAQDDLGHFEFPETARADLAAAGFTTGSLDTLARVSTTQARSGTALLLVNSLRTTYLGGDR